uniref:Peptidase metallopeptidase domain-containing protein n=1 Tax=Panagrolaimus davidi TaxID=227884 RepID=A0A914P654_9BILA
MKNNNGIRIFVFCLLILNLIQGFNLNRPNADDNRGIDYEIPADPKYIPWPKKIITYAIQGTDITSDVTLKDLRKVVREGFDIWSKYIPRDFIETTDFKTANIQLSFWEGSHNDNISFDGIGGIVAHASYKGILHYDRDEKWKRYSIAEKENPRIKDLLAVTIHEIGHVLGIGHSKIPGSVMLLDYQGDFGKNGALIFKAFSTCSSVIPMNFYQTLEINSSDIRIRFVKSEHGDNGPFSNARDVAHSVITDDHKNFEIHFNNETKWAQNIVGKPLIQNATDFYAVALKMTGGVLGLQNSLEPQSIMYYLYKKYIDENENYIEPNLSENDVKGIQKIYGPVLKKKYLTKFGYFDSLEKTSNERNAAISSDDILKNAISKFQKYTNLEETGKFDSKTKRKMAEPRCGNPDFQKDAADFDSPPPWTKDIIVYSLVGPFSSDVPVSILGIVMREAFALWSKHIPKDFIETVDIIDSDNETLNFQKAAIKIGFWKRSHGDNVIFDGNGGIVAHTENNRNLHYDIEEKWHVYSENEVEMNGTMDLFTVTLHEIGHILGLPHSNNSESIMYPYFINPFDNNQKYHKPTKLSDYDVKNIQKLYGIQELQRIYGLEENKTIEFVFEHCSEDGSTCYDRNVSNIPLNVNTIKKRELYYFIVDPPRPELHLLISKAFSTWSEIIPLDFYQTPEINSSDIQIRFVKNEHGDGQNFTKFEPAHFTKFPDGHYEIHYNIETKWLQNNVGEKLNKTGYDFYYHTLRCIGGILGLPLNIGKDSIMYWNFKWSVDENGNYIEPKLSSNDIELVQILYGVR